MQLVQACGAPGRGQLAQLTAALRWGMLLCLLLVHYALAEQLPLSSFQCVEEPHRLADNQRVCFFRDVFFWRGQLHFVTTNTSLVIPPISTRHGANMRDWGMLNPAIVPPDYLDLAGREVVRYSNDTEVYLWSTLPENNWFHQTGEYMPTLHNTLCKYLGRCTYQQRAGLVLMDIFPLPPPWNHWADWILDLDRCFAEQPRISAQFPEVLEKVMLMPRVVAGVGPECRARLFCGGSPDYDGRHPVSPHQLRLFRERIADCMGFDANRTAGVGPIRMVVIDRHYNSARHIMNMAEIYELIEQRYGDIADISLHYMEGMTAQDQIRLWASADMVVHAHGASQGSWGFLSKNAVVVHIVQHPMGVIHDNSYAEQWVSDLRHVTNVSYFPVNNVDMAYAHMKSEVVFKQDQWRSISPEDKVKVIETGSCFHVPEGPLRSHCMMWWVHKNLNLVLRPELLVPQMDAAIELLYARAGQPLPQGWPRPFDPVQHREQHAGGRGVARRLLGGLGLDGWLGQVFR